LLLGVDAESIFGTALHARGDDIGYGSEAAQEVFDSLMIIPHVGMILIRKEAKNARAAGQ